MIIIIIVEAPIASGKSTITKLLSDYYGTKPFYENADSPLLRSYYTASKEEQEKEGYPFLLQLDFLNSRFRDIKKAYKEENNILDRSIFGDKIFTNQNHAEGNISDLQLGIYNELLDNMMEELDGMPKKAPDFMVYLDISFEHTLENMKQRGRDFELNDNLESYYKELYDRYQYWVDNEYNASPIIRVDMDKYDCSRPEEIINHIESERKKLGLYIAEVDRLAM